MYVSCLTLLYSTYAQISFTQFPPDIIYPGNTYLTSWTLPKNQSFTETVVDLYSIDGLYEQLARGYTPDTEFIWTVSQIAPEGYGFYLRVESTDTNGTIIGENTPTFSIGGNATLGFLGACLIIIGITAMCCCAYGVRKRQQKHNLMGTPVPDTIGGVYVAPACVTDPPACINMHPVCANIHPACANIHPACATIPPPTCATAPPERVTAPPSYSVATATPVYSVPHHSDSPNGTVVGVVIE